MDTIRIINIFIWAAVPILLFFYLIRTVKGNILFIAFTSSIICTIFPIGVLMGTTAQPEPLFALLILAFSVTVEYKKYIISSIILTLSCMLRYEAWAVLFVFAIFFFIETIRNRKFSFKKSLNIILPFTTILFWAVLRYPFDGKFFGFLFQTQQFANDALQESNSFQGGVFKIISDIIHYPLYIPTIFMGFNILFVPFGLKKCIESNKWLCLSGAGVLFFISLSWIMKSNLGLNRHFVSLIPLYSVLTAYGILNVLQRLEKAKSTFFKKINIKIYLLAIAIIVSITYLVMWLYIWNINFKDIYTEKKSTAEFLARLNDSNTIFCNDAIVEITSNIDFHRFNRTWMENNPAATDLILNTANKEGFSYIVIPESKWKNIRNIGTVIFRSDFDKESNSSILILKIK